jgi:predicted porin
MKKSLITLAVAGALSAPAFAATSNFDISGRMAFDVTKMGSTGVSDQNTYNVNNDASRIAFGGTEDLGGGMKAGFWASYNWGFGTGSGVRSQETYAFLGGDWGTARVGTHDPLIKGFIGRKVDLFADQSTGDARYLTNQGGIDGRRDNVVAYLSPNFSGFQVGVAHGLDETKGNNAGAANMALVTYTGGPLYVGLGYDKVDLSSDQKTWRLGAGYNLGDLRFVGLYQQSDNVGGNSAADNKVWALGAGYKIGAITVKGQYYKLSDDRSAADASTYAFGADYAFSKRTTLQLAYSKLKNDANATYGGAAVTSGTNDVFTIAPGADPNRLSLGIAHTF